MNKKTYVTQAETLYKKTFFDLLHVAHSVHKENFHAAEIQKCALLSIKTGGCPEDCKYCPQSAHYKVEIQKEALISMEKFKAKLLEAKQLGAERFCLGAAWREVKDGKSFNRVLEMVRAIKNENMEACVTLGMLKPHHAQQLKEAGLTAYNHNLDTSREFYSEIISTRTFEDRLQTIQNVRAAGITVCSGGILGMGESIKDRLSLVAELASLTPQPESVPLNLLIPVQGTPLEKQSPIDSIEFIKVIAVTRILIPQAKIRLSAGRINLNRETQLLAFYAGANSIFIGEKLLTKPNSKISEDLELLNVVS